MGSAEPNAGHLEFLHYLAHLPYETAIRSLKSDPDNALRTAFQCTLNGWVDRGRLTEEGRALIAKPVKVDFEIVNLGPSAPNGGDPE